MNLGDGRAKVEAVPQLNREFAIRAFAGFRP